MNDSQLKYDYQYMTQRSPEDSERHEALIEYIDSHRNLSHMDFSRQDLSGVNLDNKHLRGCSFFRSNLHDCSLTCCELEEADFSGADICDVNFNGSYLMYCRFTGSRIISSWFEGCNASLCDFTRASIDVAFFRHRTDLSNSCFEEARLVNSDLQDAVLAQTIFTGCDVTGTSFKNTTLDLLIPDMINLDRAQNVSPEDLAHWSGYNPPRGLYIDKKTRQQVRDTIRKEFTKE